MMFIYDLFKQTNMILTFFPEPFHFPSRFSCGLLGYCTVLCLTEGYKVRLKLLKETNIRKHSSL